MPYFLPNELVLSRNRAAGMGTLEQATQLLPGSIVVWNKNTMVFDGFKIVRRTRDRDGWIVEQAPARWGLEYVSEYPSEVRDGRHLLSC